MNQNYESEKNLGMPKLWTYLIKKFTMQFILTLTGIILFLIVIRFNSIAGFATSGTDFSLILKFVGLLIPYVLPLAIPISALNASLLLSRKMSQEKQFTALRSGGLSFSMIFAPVLMLFTALCVFNLFVTGTLAPLSKTKSKTLVYDTTLKHPLFITQKACPIKIKTLYTDVGKLSSKDSASDLILAFKNKKNERLSLIMADKLAVNNGILSGKNLAIISSLKSSNKDLQDDLVIENEAFMSTSTQVVDALLYRDEAVDGVDYLDFFQLLKNLNKKAYYKTEVYKRLTVALSPLIFGFMGLCFGLSISRKSSNLSLAAAVALATVFLITLISSKSLRSQSTVCLILYLSVITVMVGASILKLINVNKGRG